MKNFLKNTADVAVNSTKITLKLAIILALILVLLIPQKMISDLVRERQGRQSDVTYAIADQIGGQEDVVGPILCIPYDEKTEKVTYDQETKLTKTEVARKKTYAYFTAQRLDITSNVEVINKNKDIYKVPFFQSKNEIEGLFAKPNFEKWENILEEDIHWDEAFILVGVTDMKGISESPKVNLAGETIEFEPGGNGSTLLGSVIHAKLPETFSKDGGAFSIEMALRGTEALNFASTAKDNQLEMTSNWPDPNFESTINSPTHYIEKAVSNSAQVFDRGNTLPIKREITDEGFTAVWNENQFSIDQPGQWLERAVQPNLHNRLMGTEFINLADEYDKTDRSVKYMALIIALVFVTFFIIELLKESRVHVFQYVLVGSAIAIFFILLLAISEYVGFNLAYLLASTATTALIGLYSLSVFRNKGMAISISALLIALFVFLFVILIAAQYSLLIGAIGLFVILALIMYVTRNVKWYGLAMNDE